MLDKLSKIRIAQFAAITAIAYAMKAWYSMASPEDLRIVLTPTTWFVSLITGEAFHFERYAGYMSQDHTFLIAAACSGVNFWITAFVMLAVMGVWKGRGWRAIPLSFFIAYLSTLVANTVRISIALSHHRTDEPLAWFDPEQMHRLEGILVYFGFLMLLYVMTERSHGLSMRRIALPLGVYWATTLGVPLANGAYRQGMEFWQHAVVVLLVPAVFVVPMAVIPYVKKVRSVPGGDKDNSPGCSPEGGTPGTSTESLGRP